MAENLEKVSTNKSKSALELLDEVDQDFQYTEVLQPEASSVPEEIVDVLTVKTTEQDLAGAGVGLGAGAVEDDAVPESKMDQEILESPEMNPEDSKGAGTSWTDLLDDVDQDFQDPEVLQSEASSVPEEIVDVLAVKTTEQDPAGAGVGTSASWTELLDEVDKGFQDPEVLQSEASSVPEEIVDVLAVKITEQDPTGVGSGAGVGASTVEDDDVPDSKTDQNILDGDLKQKS